MPVLSKLAKSRLENFTSGAKRFIGHLSPRKKAKKRKIDEKEGGSGLEKENAVCYECVFY
jgi:hypothetical protein